LAALVGVVCLVPGTLAGRGPGGGADDARPVTLTAAGEELRPLLTRAGKQLGTRLTVEDGLKHQRVSLHLQDAAQHTLMRGLEVLLSAGPEAGVSWKGKAEEWRLEAGRGRRALAAKLRASATQAYDAFLRRQAEWSRAEGPRALGTAATDVDRRAANARLAHSLFLAGLDGQGWRQLLSEEPIFFRVGALHDALRDRYRQMLCDQHGLTIDAPAALDEFAYVYLVGRDPVDSGGGALYVSVVEPEGKAGVRYTLYTRPGARAHPIVYGPLQLPEPPAEDASRKISFVLAPHDRPGVVRRNLDQILEAVAASSGVSLIWDGYLRPRAEITANVEVTAYPIKTLLDVLCRLWGCRWQYLDHGEDVVIVRAQEWWLEDQANVPEPLLTALRGRLGHGQSPDLADLIGLAELTAPQAHKLVETALCPAATGAVQPRWYDAASGARPWLRFVGRLPDSLKARAQSPEGLKLRDAPPLLVHDYLRVPLIAAVGMLSSQQWGDVSLWILPTSARNGFVVKVRRPDNSEHIYRIGETAGART